MLEVVARASQERQLALIRAHPDLVGRAALAGTLSRESTAEQRAAGLDPDALTAEEIARFQEANQAYKDRFGFPFVICARENTKDAIIAGLASRLGNDRHTEIATALREIDRIAWNRLEDIVGDDASHGGNAFRGERFRYEVSYGKQGVPVYRVFAAPLRDVPPIPESPFTGRDNDLLACEISVEVFGDEFLPAYTHGDNAHGRRHRQHEELHHPGDAGLPRRDDGRAAPLPRHGLCHDLPADAHPHADRPRDPLRSGRRAE